MFITYTIIFILLALIVTFAALRKKRSAVTLDESLEDTSIGVLQLEFGIVTASQNSNAIDDIFFYMEDYIGLTFLDLLEDVVDSEILQQTKKYMVLLNGNETNIKSIKMPNPLRKVKVSITEGDDEFIHKYVQFKFRRNKSKTKHKRILVYMKVDKHSITETNKQEKINKPDVTDTDSESLELDESLIEDFINESIPELQELLILLQQENDSEDYLKNNLNSTSRAAHKIKGDAAMLKFDEVVELLHKFEDTLTSVQKKKSLVKTDFNSFVPSINEIIACLQKIGLTIKHIDDSIRQQNNANDNTLFKRFQFYINKMSKENNKNVRIINEGFKQADIPEELKKDILSLVVQLIRNAVIHGLEDKEKRKSSEKKSYGSIYIKLQKQTSSFTITVRDDGAGLDLNKIKQVAIKSGRLSKEQIDNCTGKQILRLILQPGFSTLDKVDKNAGRGIGLDLVNATTKRLGGKLSARTRQGQFTEFSMTFPC